MGESMRRHTHRQHKLTADWLRAQWNEPDRHDHYLMQIAWLLLVVNSKDPAKVDMRDRKLKFVTSKAVPNQPAEQRRDPGAIIPGHKPGESQERYQLREHATALSKSRWGGAMRAARGK